MSAEIKHVGRYSIEEIMRRRMFLSYVVCKDDHNRNIIVGTGSPFLMTFNQRTLPVYIQEKVPFARGVMKAQTQGRLMPTQDDMHQKRHFNLRFGISGVVNQNEPMDVYFLYI